MSFKDFINEGKKSKNSDPEREFVYDAMENTEITHDQLEKKFKKKFGNTNNFEELVTSFMDSY